MVLAAGVFFWLTRALLALSPALSLGWPLKKIAACVGMAGATAYNVFSGSEIATERSLIMILVMQGAILFDRPALSLRNLAISALIVLTLHPEALLGPSFQMSYAAVAALIAMAEWFRARSDPGEDGWIARAWRWVAAAAVGLLLTTLVAGLATGPFGAYHFQSLQPYGLLGNAVTLPLVSLVVMPFGVLGVVALPFGLDRPSWAVMGYAVEAVLSLAGWVAAIPGSTTTVPAFGPGALGLFAVAILLLTLLCSGLRWFALAPAAVAMGLAATPARMDVFIARDGGSVAARGPDGRLAIIGPASTFVAEQWLRADGDGRKATEAAGPGFVLCDRIGCVARLPHGRTLALVRDRRAFEEDCRRATIVVSSLTAPPGCAAEIVVDRAALLAKGATAIRFAAGAGQPSPGAIIVTTVRDGRETRPWSVARTSARRPSARPAAEQRPAAEPDDLTRAPGSDTGEPPLPGEDLP